MTKSAVPVTISLPKGMLELIDGICEKEHKDRSEYFRDCVRFYWKTQRRLDDSDGKLKENLVRWLTRTVMEIP